MPVCTACRDDKPADAFYRNASRAGGLQARCKACDAARQQLPERRVYQRKYARANEAAIRSYRATPDRRARQSELEKQYRKDPEVRRRKRERERRRLEKSPSAKLAVNLRVRLCRAIGNEWTSGEAVRLLGCTVSQLRVYLEAQFAPGMTWENWSRTGWHIDHIRPLASFDLTDRAQLAAACHYTNLRPLWAIDNLRKNKRAA